jgi:peptidoglycan/LPS O-acetylase OafA/YrhL
MFGVWRTGLALAVMAFHLLAVPVIGEYAVFSFFVLSGFLMTTIMHKSYGYDFSGLRRYAVNRFLRLYPSYWIAIFIALLVIYFCGAGFVRSYKDDMFAPDSLRSIVSNLLMIFPSVIPDAVAPRLSPPTWAITVEIVYYVAIGLGISKTGPRSLVWLGASLAYVPATFALHLGDLYRYHAIPAGSLPFAVGACLYLYKDAIHRLLERWSISLPRTVAGYLTVFAVFAAADQLGHHWIVAVGRYVTIGAAALLTVRLYVDGVPALSRATDKLIGDYSYPIYLLHWPLGALSSFLLFHRPVLGWSAPSLAVFALDLALTGAVSSAIIFVIDPAIEKLRAQIRERSRPRVPAVA